MRQRINRKILVIGLITLFIGASLFPVINAKQIKNLSSLDIINGVEKNTNLIPPQPLQYVNYIVFFNITFYAETKFICFDTGLPRLKLFFMAFSSDELITPLARIKYITSLRKTVKVDVYERYFAIFMPMAIADMTLEKVNQGPLGFYHDPDGGWISGWTPVFRFF